MVNWVSSPQKWAAWSLHLAQVASSRSVLLTTANSGACINLVPGTASFTRADSCHCTHPKKCMKAVLAGAVFTSAQIGTKPLPSEPLNTAQQSPNKEIHTMMYLQTISVLQPSFNRQLFAESYVANSLRAGGPALIIIWWVNRRFLDIISVCQRINNLIKLNNAQAARLLRDRVKVTGPLTRMFWSWLARVNTRHS